jgi:nicotinamide/nicotinate riboside kinase
MSKPRTKTILIAVGGPTCSGKTSLVKQLCQILPEGDSFIVHQDDFAPVRSDFPLSGTETHSFVCYHADNNPRPGQPEAQLPYHPDHPEWQDWDHPPTAILWPEFQRALLHSKTHGEPSPEVQSHDHLNVQSEEEKKKVTVRDEAAGVWRERFTGLKKELEAEAEGGERVVFGFVDGFLLYWDEVRATPSALSPFRLVAPL